MRIASRQRAHRVTTANLGGIYPFHAGASLGPRGVYMGQDLLGNGAFCLDPWELYQARVISGWNMVILGTIGLGKSAWAKTWIGRQAVFGRRAWAIAPKPGEYDGLCEMLGVEPIRLQP
ncbi:MAG: conjugal transfer protein TraC, partial [Candidatus Dormibacteraeota bacterium]|nr:conjugal transfer protein TraC [Candidatus Dormibacteraeota bacterium]